MHVKVLLFLAFIVIGLCLCFMPMATEAYPHPNGRNGGHKCPPTCSIYCPCGNVMDTHNCPICRCRPSNVCGGRHPNAHPRHRQGHGKSHILY